MSVRVIVAVAAAVLAASAPLPTAGATPPEGDNLLGTSSVEEPTMAEPGRTMLGAAQVRWLEDGLSSSAAAWKIVGSQLMFAPLRSERYADVQATAALGHVLGSRFYGARKRFRGVRLVAQDAEFAAGEGAELRGPVAGRRVAAALVAVGASLHVASRRERTR